MFKTTTTYVVSPTTLLDKVFTDGIPTNAFIDKGRCAIGATYGEIIDKRRCTIIVVPNIGILLNKKDAHPELDIVYGEVSYEEVRAIITAYKPGQKIMTTPEGMSKIMKAAEETGRLNELYNDWFLLLDEAHTFITESYREDILRPFDYFWDFKQKSVISATPYIFTDIRFKILDYHKIEFTATLGKVTVVNAVSVPGTLNYMLQQADNLTGNLHIFYNSVREIRDIIIRSGITKCNIYCADDQNGDNKIKLGELVKHFVSEPKTGNYKKINFYTCKYFEGWDLYDDSAIVVLVTDVHKPHTKVGVSTKGKQAIGRLRDTPLQILHITNHHHVKYMKPLDTFKEEYTLDANFLIKQNEEYIAYCSEIGTKPKEDQRLIKYADINKTTKSATLNTMKLDQQINESASNEVYNHIKYIYQAWKDAYFEVDAQYSDHKLETGTTIKRKSASKQFKEDYKRLLDFKKQQGEHMIFYLGSTKEEEVKRTNPIAYKAYKLLDEATVKKLNYNVKKIEAAIILKENTLAEVKLLRLLFQYFRVNERYTNEYIKNKLQELYNTLSIKDESGKIKIATANQLAEKGRFETKECKIPQLKGKPVNGYIVMRQQFNLRMAA